MKAYDPMLILQMLSVGHRPDLRDNDFWAAVREAEAFVKDILANKCVDVHVEGPAELIDQDPLVLIYDFVAAVDRTAAYEAGYINNNDDLGLAQQAIHKFVMNVMPHCTYRLKARFTKQRIAMMLPVRGTWGRMVATPQRRISSSSTSDYTPFKEVPK